MPRRPSRDLWGWRHPVAYGATDDGMPEVEGAPSTLQANLPAIVEAAVTALEAAQDPARRVEVLRVRVQQARAAGDESRAQILEARLRGWQRRLALDEEAVQSRREWRGLGKALLFSGIALIVVLSAAALRFTRRKR